MIPAVLIRHTVGLLRLIVVHPVHIPVNIYIRLAEVDEDHTHIAAPDRTMPATDSDIAQCKVWAQALKDCGYAGRMSLEGKFAEDFKADIARTRKILDLFNE